MDDEDYEEEFFDIEDLVDFIDDNASKIDKINFKINDEEISSEDDLLEVYPEVSKKKILDLGVNSTDIDFILFFLQYFGSTEREYDYIYISQDKYEKYPDLLEKFNITEDKLIIISDTNTRNELEDYSWEEINIISQSGKAERYFNIGDEKNIELNNETYAVEIIGFNHDDLADGSGKAGITFSTKELVISHQMNFEYTNSGGWEASEMREYVNTTIFESLSSELQSVIKTVDKKTSIGNTSDEIITSEDKIFLLSTIEVLGELGYSKAGEGEQYQYYADGGSKIKYHNGSTNKWWTRSPNGGVNFAFATITSDGKSSSNEANSSNFAIFAFCI